MKQEKIPNFFTADMWKKYISIWFLPLLFFLLTMYIIAFTKDSFVFIIFSMAIMMHPAISIPMSFSLKCVKFLTMSTYFAMITFVQFYFTYTWDELRSYHINYSYKSGKTWTVNNTFGNRYDQCDCDGTDSKCLVDITDRKTNIIGYTNYVTSSEMIPYIMIGFAIIQIISLVCIELLWNEAVSMIQYMLGPKDWLISPVNTERKAPSSVPIPSTVICVQENMSIITNVASPNPENVKLSSSKVVIPLQDSRECQASTFEDEENVADGGV